jgi:hypothetical protein
VIHYDNTKTRIHCVKYHKKPLLTESIYISADYAIIRRYNLLSITNKFEIKLLRGRRGKKEGWREEEGGKVNT